MVHPGLSVAQLRHFDAVMAVVDCAADADVVPEEVVLYFCSKICLLQMTCLDMLGTTDSEVALFESNPVWALSNRPTVS